ncbi:hypothetical protein ACIPSJ_46120 [Streptomyces sp. NPDC090088]|uniref:hypothetical protein n=1 Tax=Streptomyces sp. NPDC090088 TaxID=3365944 RepID=UPI0037F1B431
MSIAHRTPGIDACVLHGGAARVPGTFRERMASLRTAIERAFDDAGRTSVRAVADHGTWLPLKLRSPEVLKS